jgi:hypothetical protein
MPAGMKDSASSYTEISNQVIRWISIEGGISTTVKIGWHRQKGMILSDSQRVTRTKTWNVAKDNSIDGARRYFTL